MKPFQVISYFPHKERRKNRHKVEENVLPTGIRQFRKEEKKRGKVQILGHPQTTSPDRWCISHGTFPCNSACCKTCTTVCNTTVRYQVSGNFNCVSFSVVYPLSCTSCDTTYVEETGRALRERMTSHRHDIRTHADTPVAHYLVVAGHMHPCVVGHSADTIRGSTTTSEGEKMD